MRKLYSLLLMCLSITSFAQSYQFTVYNTENSGIAANNINDFKKSATGTYWIATNNGLSAMIGNSFTNYTTTNSGIATNMLHKIALGTNNKVWVSTYGEGIVLRNGSTWSHYTVANSGLPTNNVAGIAADGLGNLWIASASGLTKFNGTTWSTYTTANSNLNFSNNITSVFTDSSNNVWISGGNVLQKFNGTTFTTITDGVEKILKVTTDKIYVDTFDGLGIIVGTDYENLYWTSNSCLAGCAVEALDLDENEEIWLGLNSECTSGGIQRFTDCITYTTANSALPHNDITSILVEDSNVIWAGTLEGGLVKMNLTDDPVGCNVPYNVLAEATSSTTATISWQPANPAPAGYLYVYNTEYVMGGTDGYTTSTSANLEGLSPNTDYYWWVASDCEPQQWTPGGMFTTQGNATTCFVQIKASSFLHTLGIKADGTLWAWGNNTYYQLGDGTNIDRNTPVQIGTSNNWKTVSAGDMHSIGIKTDGTLWVWGTSEHGALALGNTTFSTVPVQIGSSSDWEEVTTGASHNVALKTDGTIWTWGRNQIGQLGTGNTTSQNIPTQIGTSSDWAYIATGMDHTFGIRTNGTLWAWGANNNGQLGDGTTINKSVPTQVGTATNWQNVDGGAGFSVGTRTNGTLWTWGNNFSGQLGLGNNTNSINPTQVGTATNWANVTAGIAHTLATRTYGALFAWGVNNFGQIGNGTTTNVNTPYLLMNSDSWPTFSVANNHSAAVAANGNLYTWGLNNYGQLGNGTNTNTTTMGVVACPTSLGVEDIDAINTVKIYPNPTNNILNITANTAITTVALYNMLGQQVIAKSINANQTSIDVSNLAIGTYLLKIQAGNETKTSKIIKN